MTVGTDTNGPGGVTPTDGFDVSGIVQEAVNNAMTAAQNPTAAQAAAAREGAWYPRRPSTVFVDTSSLGGIEGASDTNSSVYNTHVAKADLVGALSRPESQGWLFSLVAAGRKHGSTPAGVLKAFVAESASRNNEAGENITPQQLAFEEATKNGWIKDGKITIDPSTAGQKAPKYTGPVTTNSTTSDTTLTNPDTAHSILSNALSQHLGRTAKPGELDAFIKILHGREQQNPQTQQMTSTTTPNAATHVNDVQTSRTSQGGTDPAQLADQFAASQEGAAEYTSTQFLDAFIANLKDPVG